MGVGDVLIIAPSRSALSAPQNRSALAESSSCPRAPPDSALPPARGPVHALSARSQRRHSHRGRGKGQDGSSPSSAPPRTEARGRGSKNSGDAGSVAGEARRVTDGRRSLLLIVTSGAIGVVAAVGSSRRAPPPDESPRPSAETPPPPETTVANLPHPSSPGPRPNPKPRRAPLPPQTTRPPSPRSARGIPRATPRERWHCSTPAMACTPRASSPRKGPLCGSTRWCSRNASGRRATRRSCFFPAFRVVPAPSTSRC